MLNIRILSRILATAFAFAVIGTASIAKSERQARSLSFYHTHTGQELTIVYKEGREYVPGALREINAFLRDFRTGDVAEIDPALLDLLYDLRTSLGSASTYEVISAYRSPKTNDLLRKKGGGVARKSQHLLGKAIDVRLRGTDTKALHKKALEMKRGGVGYYPKLDFVHIDTGRVRFW